MYCHTTTSELETLNNSNSASFLLVTRKSTRGETDSPEMPLPKTKAAGSANGTIAPRKGHLTGCIPPHSCRLLRPPLHPNQGLWNHLFMLPQLSNSSRTAQWHDNRRLFPGISKNDCQKRTPHHYPQ